MKDAVAYVNPVNLLYLTSKSSSFQTDKWAINNNTNVSFSLNTIASSGLIAQAKIQGSLDGSTWYDLKNMKADINGDDDILFTINNLDSLFYFRVNIIIVSGSAIFNIVARAV